MNRVIEITLDNCLEIVQKDLQSQDVAVVEFSDDEIKGDVPGIMGDYYRLQVKVRFNNNLVERHYFVKKMVAKYEVQTEMIKIQKAFEKENFTYNFLSKVVEMEPKYSNSFIPRCFLSVMNDKFVLEDLSYQGYKSKDEFFLNLDHCRITLKMLAKFHASSIIYENKRSSELGRRFKLSEEFGEFLQEPLYQEDPEYLGNKLYQTAFKAAVALIDKIPDFAQNKEQIKNNLLMHKNKMFDVVKESNDYLNVLNHGDIWVSNIFFKYDNDQLIDCKLIDFQAIKYSLPANDFLYFIHASNNTDFVNKHQPYLQDYYYNCLKEYLATFDINLNNYMTYETFVKTVEYCLPSAIIQKACFSTMILLLNESFKNNSEKFRKFMYEERTKDCLEAYDRVPFFRDVINDAYKNLKLL